MKPIFRLIYLVHPKPAHPQYGAVDGAYATCWVNDPVYSSADQAARQHLAFNNWELEEADEHVLVTEESCPRGTEGREYFEQAQLDDLVLVLHTWPVGAPDSE